MNSWPGIPDGKGSTCIEEGCGNPRRARGNDCRPCYKRKHQAHRRAAGDDPNSWAADGHEVGLTSSIVRELDITAYDDWQRRKHV